MMDVLETIGAIIFSVFMAFWAGVTFGASVYIKNQKSIDKK